MAIYDPRLSPVQKGGRARGITSAGKSLSEIEWAVSAWQMVCIDNPTASFSRHRRKGEIIRTGNNQEMQKPGYSILSRRLKSNGRLLGDERVFASDVRV
jgi:hypothetical protein